MREKHRLAASCTPPTGDVPATKVHALDRNRTWDPLVHRPTLYPLSQTSQGFNVFDENFEHKRENGKERRHGREKHRYERDKPTGRLQQAPCQGGERTHKPGVQFSIRDKLIRVLSNWNGCNTRLVYIFALEDSIPVPHVLQVALPRAAIMEVFMLMVLSKTCTGQGVANSLEKRSHHHTLCLSANSCAGKQVCVYRHTHNMLKGASLNICIGS
ncbi:hypothetical protein MDA_GLEAN10008673 [Myotis davidii]|uniref:Uncharacterized protein n=1 Tax=Myotis davidii TaxID=225400 RepID=L5LSR1_MYODS|nr:hypothetical protein MDA_GLEAN10008673 [Myotis davidii]